MTIISLMRSVIPRISKKTSKIVISSARIIWRVSKDGEIRDPYRKLVHVFEMEESDFFTYYADKSIADSSKEFLNTCKSEYASAISDFPDIPFSNLWIAKNVSKDGEQIN